MSLGIAIIGSGNIGTDLMVKVKRLSEKLEVAALVGIDPASDGLARAKRLGIATTADGVKGLVDLPEFKDVRLVFDATSAAAHRHNYDLLREHGLPMVDLTPAAVGPYVVPPVNLDAHLDAPNVNMVTCGGQATTPIVAAVSAVAPVAYAEIVASIASRSAGPGTRANIDEFTETTSRALEVVGGAERGKAVIILNPAEPPMKMRDTVFCLLEHAAESEVDESAISVSVAAMVAKVQQYVPGYRLKQEVQFDPVEHPFVPGLGRPFRGTKVSVFLEVTGAGHYLPDYAGNLDIMTSAALRTAERLLERKEEAR
ncbi:acetaldehyde dehydrogenase (acetylating) [Amycolatopsis rhabdoformis]|uniref:Acetaldehyde dehydrogenase n=1 Tax=Amycolatopsis rhabdoformis TaxID=1448059 RepID=A0ABZ1IIT7_9PSEU|nr:acetaldehyde dehydrogenase (acetylating) [Amycolatopsis rhabdoformis]WSE34177.1 acetaldehyde dehydrogenase (acetylating) [Amycolatopsis rhabdoformis]